MYLPPAASWSVARARWPRHFVVVTGLLGLSLCLWLAASQPWSLTSAILLTLPGLCLVAAALGLRQTSRGQLRWDGTHWHWVSNAADAYDQPVTQIVCTLDLQRLMLVRIVCEPATVRWLWLESRAMDARWLALRRAVVAPPHNSLPE